MRNVKMIIQYDGTRYNGWQKQNQKGSTVTTIQGKIENVLSKMTGEEVDVIGCGRTDSGVHVENYVANFFTDCKLTLDEMEKYLEEYLPKDIVVKELKIAKDRFHARYNVKGKTYVYRIDNNKYNNVFNRDFTNHIPIELNIEQMKKAAEYLIGTHDFKSFTSLKAKNNKSTLRTINYINIIKNNGLIEIEVNGNSFLLNMVRIIAGTLIEVGEGKLMAEDVETILMGKNREKAGHKAPAKGLILKELQY
ncbi:tRNA pseudouridine synthase A [Clostridium liquoris]|jgi:tRNA pseudouridine38-40 synthase|uniref:tRNA pseudouridine synthase A n=1 Tax=Clostridium liquoris TaxID=1289519 RepID=A0A2T0B3U8_9CLOT|nr:tRNA pseudouridine(38-40) synthase TruA [Clostridium liquoris]PRR78559.1 tRNA pseudouridine synthase A [Clostridium liquoris]